MCFKGRLTRSALSAIVLGIFVFLAAGCLFFPFDIPIEVYTEYKGAGMWEETETHDGGEKIVSNGGKDDKQRWHGKIVRKYTNEENPNKNYTEVVYMEHGVRQGMTTRTYPDGREEQEHYLNGVRWDLKKGGRGGEAEFSAYGILQNERPWFLFALEAFGYDGTYTGRYLDTLETLLYSYDFQMVEFLDYYDMVLDTLSETPFDSIVTTNSNFSLARGFREMKNDELRQAVIDRYRSGESPTYEMVTAKYPNYLKTLKEMGATENGFEEFCTVLDDTLNSYGTLDTEDIYFVDSVDARFFRAMMVIMESEQDTSAESSSSIHALSSRVSRQLIPEIRKVQLFQETPAEVAEMALMVMLSYLLRGDLIQQAVEEAYALNQEVVFPPMVSTELLSIPSATSATIRGTVTHEGGGEVTERGIAWATFHNPTINDQAEPMGAGLGSFSVTLDGLPEDAVYFARAYATNSAGTSYGNSIEFTLSDATGSYSSRNPRKGFLVYPNPASLSARLRFQTLSESEVSIELVSISGQVVRRLQLGRLSEDRHEVNLDLSGIAPGTYSCLLMADGLPEASVKLVVEH